MLSVLDPKLDVVFKLLFGSEKNRDVLISLLTAVLKPHPPIGLVEVLNSEIPKEAVLDKGIALDLRIRLLDGSQIDVEMQSDRRPGFRKRALYYWARLHGSQLERGGEYTGIRPTFLVVFTDFVDTDSARLHSIFKVIEVHDGSLFGEDLALHLVELRELERMSDEESLQEAELVHWARFLAARTDAEIEEAAMGHPMVTKAKGSLEELSASPDVREMARTREMALLTYKIELGEAREEGKAEGKAEGTAVSLLTILSVRGLETPEELRLKILRCQDNEQLVEWTRRAVTAASLDEIFR
jgi:predicted transposase/invertase (TIGR01784 family)